jgi:AraC family transcriptional regulator, ethanolamine operon transcriptional activator
MTGAKATAVDVKVAKVSSSDIDEHAAALSEWNQRYLQMARGPFTGQLKHLEFSGGLKIFRETTNLKISEYFITPANRTSLAIPLPGSAPVRFANQEAGPGDLIMFRPGEGYHLECREAFDVIGIEIDAPDVPKLPAACALVMPCDDSAAQFLTSAIEAVQDACQDNGLSQACAELAARIDDNCRRLLTGCRAPGCGANGMNGTSARTAIVARARSVIAAKCQEPISVLDLARTLDISTRTLEYSFQEILNTTPASYIKIVRLHEARRAIRACEPGRTVTDIASTWGFWHFGRFASDYRKLFGELPSETRTARRAFAS